MTPEKNDEVSFLELTLHGTIVGHLAGYRNGKNSLSFTDEFKHAVNRPTFSLITHPRFPRSQQLMATPWNRNHRLHPSLSNLLPEGVLRELIAQGLKVHVDNEFQLFSYLGEDLPGALIAKPLEPDDVPAKVLAIHSKAKIIRFEKLQQKNKFSLAGIQMKFSMKEKDGRYNLNKSELGDWIIKTPSTKHKDVPVNEFSAMTLASMVGIEIPEIKLVDLGKLDNLPQINLPNEEFAFAIKRFDRKNSTRVHTEDFAQVLVKYPHEKYKTANYEQIGRVLYEYSDEGLSDAQQFARRLLVNILLANGDAHLKNWSLIYSNKVTPVLSPAYDIVTTSVYIDGEKSFALNMGGIKGWYKVNYTNFEEWVSKADIPWRAIKPHLDDVMDKARTLWPTAIKQMPMNETHKKRLAVHWKNLHVDFKI